MPKAEASSITEPENADDAFPGSRTPNRESRCGCGNFLSIKLPRYSCALALKADGSIATISDVMMLALHHEASAIWNNLECSQCCQMRI